MQRISKIINKRALRYMVRELLLALTYPFFFVVIFLMWFVPRKIRIIIGKRIAQSIWDLDKRTYRITTENLRRAFPDKSDAEIHEMAKEAIQNMIRTMFDFFSSAVLISKKRFFSMVEIEGKEHLQKAYDRGKGVICMIPHLSAWELSAVTPPMMGYITYAASKRIKGFLYNFTFINLRRKRGMINISRKGSYAKLLEVLNKGYCLIIMADQDTMVKGEFIPFFGTPAYTPIGISRMALDTEAAVVPMAMTRKADGLYKFTIYSELPTIRTGDYSADCTSNTQAQTAEYERIIRTTPTQWVWMHKRWKTTPETLARFLAIKKLQREEREQEERERGQRRNGTKK